MRTHPLRLLWMLWQYSSCSRKNEQIEASSSFPCSFIASLSLLRCGSLFAQRPFLEKATDKPQTNENHAKDRKPCGVVPLLGGLDPVKRTLPAQKNRAHDIEKECNP